MLQLFEENIDGITVLYISGSLTPAGLPAVEARFDGLAGRKAARVVADLGDVDAITTPAFTLMLRTARAVKERGGMMVFANAKPEVRKTFACCRLDLVLDLASDVTAAVEVVRSADRDPPSPLLPPDARAGGNDNLIQ